MAALPEVKRAPRRLDGYIRVSRIAERHGASFISPDEQRDLIEKWAALRGIELAGWETDLDQSGGTQNRPGLRRIMQRIAGGETDGIVVAKLDRFARNVWEAGADILTIRKAQGHLVSVQEGIDPTTEFGEFALTLMLAIAKLERDQRSPGWKSAKARAVERGAHIGPTPTGMQRIADGEHAGKLAPDPEWLDALRILFQQAAVIRTHSGLAAYMNASGPRPDGRAWTGPTVRNILRNRVYVGEVRYRYRDGLHHENLGAHEGVVDEETWLAAQREPGEQFRRTGSPSVLAGLVRCQACRHRMSPGPGGRGAQVRVYRCTRTHATGRCPAPSVVVAANLETWALERLKAAVADRAYVGRPVQDADGQAALQRFEAAQHELERYMADAELEAAAGAEAWRAGALSRTARRDEAKAEYEAVADRAPVPDLSLVSADVLDDLDVDELAEVYRSAIDAIVIRRAPRGSSLDERAVVIWRGQAPDDLPGKGRGNGGPLRPFDWPDRLEAVADVPAAQHSHDRAIDRAKRRRRRSRGGD